MTAGMEALERAVLVMEEVAKLNEEMVDFPLSDQFARMMDETPEVAARLVTEAMRAVLNMQGAFEPDVLAAVALVHGAKLVVAGRRAGPSPLLVSSICDTLLGRYEDSPNGPQHPEYFQAIVRQVLELAEVI